VNLMIFQRVSRLLLDSMASTTTMCRVAISRQGDFDHRSEQPMLYLGQHS